jgi:hypothetical protein
LRKQKKRDAFAFLNQETDAETLKRLREAKEEHLTEIAKVIDELEEWRARSLAKSHLIFIR